jgi:hypothetical protein
MWFGVKISRKYTQASGKQNLSDSTNTRSQEGVFVLFANE